MKKLFLFVFTLMIAFSVYAQQPIMLEWSEPTSRENGDALPPEEIGGYEIRYYENSATEHQSFVLERSDSPITSFTLETPLGDHKFEISAYDTDGLYSEFVPLNASVESRAPSEVLDFRFNIINAGDDPVGKCLENDNCQVIE